MAGTITYFRKLALAMVLFAILGTIILSFDFSPVDLIPNNASTADSLICTWNSGTSQVNVTWYNGTNLYNRIINASNPQSISALIAKRGQNWNCTVVEWNDTSNILSDSVTVKNANPAPPTISNLTIYEDQLWSTTLTSSDPDGDLLEFFCLPASTLDICDPNGYVSWTPLTGDVEPARYRIYNVSFYAYDPLDGISVTKIQINVTAVNDPPTFSNSMINRTVFENQTFGISINVTDEENATGPFYFTVNSSYYPPIEKITFNSSNNRSFLLMFSPNNRKANYTDRGNWTVWIKACDPVNGSICVNSSFNLEVVPINQIPVFTLIPNASGTQNSNFLLYINASDEDGSDTLNFSVVAQSCPLPNPWTISTLISSSNATGFINASPLTNTHIVCRNITVYVTDGKAVASQNVYLNLSNANDPPVIYNFSFEPSNTHSNFNISNLIAYRDANFRYAINASDPDRYYNYSEPMIFSDNSSLCSGNCPSLTINASSGMITFVPNVSFIGNYSYTINLTDLKVTTSAILVLHVINNTAPTFIHPPADKIALEDNLFTYKLNATDNEGGFDRFSLNTNLFNITTSGSINYTGLINFTPKCQDVGNWTIAVKINDTIGAYNISNFNLEIRMTPDAPLLPVVANTSIVEEIPYQLDLRYPVTTDDDISCGQLDNLTYTSTFLSGQTLFNISNNGVIDFTANSTSNGNYLVNISVGDLYSLKSSFLWNITIVNRTLPPVINNITPYGNPGLILGWKVLLPGDDNTNINASENLTVLFDHNSTDPENNPLVFNWTVNEIAMNYTKNFTYYWNFTTAGNYRVVLKVLDNVSGTLAHEVKFTWNMTINSVNRPPVLISPLPNVTLNKTGKDIPNYLSGTGWGVNRFYDPDNDTLTYNATQISVATISIYGNSVQFIPTVVGAEQVTFSAYDGQYLVYSNNVTVNVTELPEQEESSGTTTTKTKSDTSYIPYSVIQEVEKNRDIYFDILVPEPVTIYKNETIREVIGVQNKGNITLRGILLSAETNNTDVKIEFSTKYFAELLPGEIQKTDLILTSYRLLSKYEVTIWANVTDPAYRDKAVLYINSIEKSRGNQSVTATKITFAQDLLNSNPECLELNEFLKKAQDEIQQENYDEASKILDQVIQGCKYLVSQSKLRDERPSGIVLGINLDSSPYIKPVLAIFIIAMIAAVYLTVKARKQNQNNSL